MWTTFFIMAIILQDICKGQKKCEIFPKNQVVTYGSNLTLSFRAPPNGDCRKMSSFNTSTVTWRLNNESIKVNFYNSTVSSVFIPNFTLVKGTVECLWDDTVLDGTIIHLLPSRPQNVSCIGKWEVQIPGILLTCEWDHNQHDPKTEYKYTVLLKQTGKELYCRSSKKSCTFQDEKIGLLDSLFNVIVIAQNSAGNASSDEITYDIWTIVQRDPPADIQVKPELTSLKVTWMLAKEYESNATCEMSSEPVVKTVKRISQNTYELTEVTPCTNYSISVRCRPPDSVWSTWSPVTALSPLNVSNEPFYLWRTRSILHDKKNRTMHLMWKGISPSCNGFDGYRLLDHTLNSNLNMSKRFTPFQNHTFIALDENAHIISLAAVHNDTNLKETSVEIPATAEDISLPPVSNVSSFARDCQIHITWNKPDLPVSGYIIIWNSTEENHKWLQTQETKFSLKGQVLVLYTISLTPIYDSGPGNETRLHSYAQEGAPVAVSVRVERISDRKAEIHWQPVLTTQCCALVVSYTVFYETQSNPEPRNVTVNHNQHSVILDDLEPKTTYTVYVYANSVAASSKSIPYRFTTNAYGETMLIVLSVCIAGLMLLSVFIALIRKAYLNEKVPDPRLSSLSLWYSQKCRNQWNQVPLPSGCESEKILTCQVEAEDHKISTSTRDVAKLKACTIDQNTAIQETTRTEAEKSAVVSLSKEMKLASAVKEERTRLFPPLDLQTTQIHPVPSCTPYRNQTPVTSPVDSPRKLLPVIAKPGSSEEAETLLKPKHRNPDVVTTYVTVDMFEHCKRQSK